jgi:hypothetical protein
MMRRLAVVALLAAGCAADGPAPLMRFDRAHGLFDAPFPSDDLVRDDGTIDLSRFPNLEDIDLVNQALALLGRDARGFAESGAVYFALGGPLDARRLPSLAATTRADAPVFLMAVDAASPDFLKRQPVTVSFDLDGGPFGAPNLLSLLPVQGVPLRAKTTYAAGVLGRLGAPPLGAARAIGQLAAGTRPSGMSPAAFDRYRRALAVLPQAGVHASDLGALAVFTTDDPTAQLSAVVADMLSRPLPTLAPFTAGEMYGNFCVYSSSYQVPVYQQGTPWYQNASDGGGWVFDGSGKPIVQRVDMTRLVVTVPQGPIPDAGLPLVVFVRTGGGGDLPLIDRGVQASEGGAAVPGSGPAMEFARVGFAGAQVDGPIGGPYRNPMNLDEQVAIFNFNNAAALRDNVRQSAAELALLAHLLPGVSFDAGACPHARASDGTARVHFDLSHLVLMGHSMGSSIAPLTLAVEPMYGAAIFSGAGASYIENVMYKEKPFAVRPLAEGLLSYQTTSLSEHDPVLSLVQWGAEPSDAQVYTRSLVREPPAGQKPRHVLMLQGIVDHYQLPNIANATSLSLGLDLGGTPLDTNNPGIDYTEETTLEDMLPYSGRRQVALPASGNVTASDGTQVTAVVTQHPEDGILDGHEIAFQTEPPKIEYRCFLKTLLRGLPVVSDGDCP